MLNHKVIFEKMLTLGFEKDVVDWFKSYLSNRKMYVEISNSKSEMQTNNIGIPQGSILGPEIFLYLINDVKKCLKYSSCILFADDTTIYVIGKNLKCLKAKLQHDITALENWLDSNALLLNVKKTKLMLFSDTPLCYDKFEIKYKNSVLDIVDSFKFLGILFDSKVDFNRHAENIIAKLRYQMYTLKNVVKFVNSHTLKIIFYSLINSTVAYGLICWFDQCNATQKGKLVKLYDTCLRICNLNTTCLSIEKLNFYEKCRFNFQFMHGDLPDGLYSAFNSQSQSHSYNTRNKNSIKIPKHKSQKINKSFIVKTSYPKE